MISDPTPIFKRQLPVGTFHAVSCRDASSLARDGQPYLAVNQLDTADGRPLVEIQFADGVWFLADPTTDLVPGFFLDHDPERVYLAHSYGDPWNGWATPVIDRQTLAQLLDHVDEPHRWDGASVWVADDETPFEPREDGLYDTSFLGWTFWRALI